MYFVKILVELLIGVETAVAVMLAGLLYHNLRWIHKTGMVLAFCLFGGLWKSLMRHLMLGDSSELIPRLLANCEMVAVFTLTIIAWDSFFRVNRGARVGSPENQSAPPAWLPLNIALRVPLSGLLFLTFCVAWRLSASTRYPVHVRSADPFWDTLSLLNWVLFVGASVLVCRLMGEVFSTNCMRRYFSLVLGLNICFVFVLAWLGLAINEFPFRYECAGFRISLQLSGASLASLIAYSKLHDFQMYRG